MRTKVKNLACAAVLHGIGYRQAVAQALQLAEKPTVEKCFYTIQAGTLIIKDISDYYLIIKILKEHSNNDNIAQVLLYLRDSGCYDGAMAMMHYLREYPKKVILMNNIVGTMGGRDSQLNVQQLAEAYKDIATSFDDFRKAVKPLPQPKSKYHK